MKKTITTGLFLCLFSWTMTMFADTKIEMKGDWQVQPATTVKELPKQDQWGKWGIRNWRWSGKPKGLPWSNIKAGNVNSIWLKTTFEVPTDWVGSKILLDFQRLEGDAIVFINGENVGERLRPYGTIDITKAAKAGKNELRMFVTRDYTDISRGAKEDPLRYFSRKDLGTERLGLGVTAPVLLERIPRPAGIADVFVKTSFRKKTIAFETEIDAGQKVEGLVLEAKIQDKEGKEVLAFKGPVTTVSAGVSKHTISSKWENPILWELESGYVYNASVTLQKDGKTLDSYTTEFGFREVWTEGRSVILNGHPSRWRIEWTSFGITEKSLPLLKMVGRNVVYAQPNPTSWWRDWAEVPYFTSEEIELLDRAGVGLSLPVPGVSHVRNQLLDNPKLIEDYNREMEEFIKRYRNHPAILAYSVGMNSFNPKDAIHPDTMGKRSDYTHSQAKVINKSLSTIKKYDPTRLGYSHADGNLGDIATANCYPNFAPVQEYEDWPAMWAKQGDMPWFACEFSAFYNGSLYKGKQVLLTEFASMYFGEDAFNRESEEQLANTMRIGLEHRSHGNNIKEFIKVAPIYWDLNRIHVVNTDRAWRTWGVTGWHYFNFGIGYGDPPEMTSKRPFNRYDCLKEKVTKVPDWVNPFFHTYRKNMQPLLAYIAGSPVHTDKDHGFFAGEQVKKQIAIVWDGPGAKDFKAEWQLVDQAGKVLTKGAYDLKVNVGDIKFSPIEFTAPSVDARTDAKIELTVKEGDKVAATNSFAVQFFPTVKTVTTQKRVILFDPAKKSTWVKDLTKSVVPYTKGMALGKTDILVIGREALKKGDKLPYTLKDIDNGLNVIFLEQQPIIWEGLGFKSLETAPRFTFMGDKSSPILEGLKPADLLYWRGSPDLVPEFKHARGYDVVHAPKSTNRNTVASCVLRIPQKVGFTPVAVAAFGLEFSPLLTFRTGKGIIVFSSFDLTDRVRKSPAPTLIAANMLQYVDGFKAAGKPAYYAGNEQGKEVLEQLQCAKTKDLENSVVVEYGTSTLPKEKLGQLLQAGGKCVSIDLTPSLLEKSGIQTVEKKIYKATKPDVPGVTSNLVRWRDALDVNTIAGGIFKQVNEGNGTRQFLQVGPTMLKERYLKDSDKRENILLSIGALDRLTALVLTNAGCLPSRELLERMSTLTAGASYKNLSYWMVLGPFDVKPGVKVPESMDVVYPGEKNAIAGDTNPNLIYTGAGGKKLDFRTGAMAGGNGFIDVGKALNVTSESGIAYATKTVNCEKAGVVTIRLGVDYFMKVWVNGKLEYAVTAGHGSPKPNRHIFKVKMKKGENVITLKIRSGSKGFGFWANMSEPQDSAQKDGADQTKEMVKLYDPSIKYRDPYEYHYW